MSEPDCLSESTVRLIPLWYLFPLASLLSPPRSLFLPPKDTKLASVNPKPPTPSRRRRQRNVTMRRMHPSAHTQVHCSCHTQFFPTPPPLQKPSTSPLHLSQTAGPSSASLISPLYLPLVHSGNEMLPHGDKRGTKFSPSSAKRREVALFCRSGFTLGTRGARPATTQAQTEQTLHWGMAGKKQA